MESKQAKQIESLQPAYLETQKLKDEVQELTIERNNLLKKANALEKYKQKLQANQSLEVENRHLRQQVEGNQKQLAKYEAELQKTAGLQLTIQKYQETIGRVEQDNYELVNMKQQHQLDKEILVDRLERAREVQARSEETMQELRDEIASLELGVAPQARDGSDLESQLKDNSAKRNDLYVVSHCLLLCTLRLLTIT